jgi:hypothetical protein
MTIFIFQLKTADVFIALDEDGTILGSFGNAHVGTHAAKYISAGHKVEVVEHPEHHHQLQMAVRLNKLRATLATNGEQWAQVELFRWQYGELPEANDLRPRDVPRGLKNMAVAVAKGEVSWENIAVVMVYVADLLSKGEGHAG